MNNLQLLIKKAESRNKKSSFTVSTKFTLEDIFEDKDKTEITYCEDDLTKNYSLTATGTLTPYNGFYHIWKKPDGSTEYYTGIINTPTSKRLYITPKSTTP